MSKKKNKNKKKQAFTKEEIENALRPLTRDQMETLTREQLLIVLEGEQKIRKFYEDIASKAMVEQKELEDKVIELEGKLVRIKNVLYNPKTEKTARKKAGKLEPKRRIPTTRNRNLEEKYPDAEIDLKILTLETLPNCTECQSQMSEMGTYEQSQQLVTIEKKYLIRNILRMKYCCSTCNSCIQTTPQLPKIVPRGVYSDEFLTDLAVSKFCDLIPVERYCEMAARGGFAGLPTSSLHEGLQRFAEFLRVVFEQIRIEVLDAEMLMGDETTHRMLEGHEKKLWYLWGLFCNTGCFFECHPTRSGEVAIDVLSESGCHYFISDAYSGYKKAIKETNHLRKLAELPLIVEVNCNAHARRKFDECGDQVDANTFIAEYREIYKNEKVVKALLASGDISNASTKRAECKKNFDRMKVKAEQASVNYPSYHHYNTACQYFLNNFEGLTACIADPKIPLDNNASERGLRSSVIGRKTWYGTHSEQGAETAAIYFTIVQSCKIVGVNPREYYRYIIKEIHNKNTPLTPSKFRKLSLEVLGSQ